MKLALQIAWRFLTSAKKQTLIIILGISVGVSVQVFIGSLISGLQKSLVDSTIGSSSHITIKHETDVYIDNYQIQMDALDNYGEQLTVVSPVFDIGGIVEKGDDRKEVLLRGFDLGVANQMYGFKEKLTEGEMPNALNEVILGVGVKQDLNLGLNEMITIDVLGEFKTFKVVGFFDFNVAIVNRMWGVTSLSTLQAIIDDPLKVTSIEIQIKEVFDAQTLSLTIENDLQDQLTTTNWMDENKELLSGLQGQSISSLMIQVFVIISVVLGISSTLAITVMQKSRQIGILKAMGIQDSDASKVFLFEGFILGIFGAIGGVIFGLGLAYSFTAFAVTEDGSPVVPLNIEPGFIALSALIALFASTIAALTPAIKSSKLTVIEVIRNA